MKSIYLFACCIIILFSLGCGKKTEIVEPVQPPPPPPPVLPKELTFTPVNPTVKRKSAVSFVMDEKAYIVFGEDNNSNMVATVRMYDPNSGTWQILDDVPNKIGNERTGAVAFAIGDQAYVFGGYDGNNPVGKFCSYDPIQDKWNAEPPAPLTPRAGSVSFVINSTAYILGGYDGNNMLAELFSFKPGVGWTQLNNFPGGTRYGASSFVIDGSAYVVAGIGANIFDLKNDLWKYDAGNDVWVKMANLPTTGRFAAVSFAIGESEEKKKGYVFSGYAGGIESFNDGWEYDPETDSWEEIIMPNAFLARYGASGTALNDSEAIIVGGENIDNGQLGDTWKGFFQEKE